MIYSKELEALNNLVQSCFNSCDSDEVLKNKLIVEKALKTLEIIKEKYVDVDLLWDVGSSEEYNSEIMFSYQIITEEEFNLLREMLQ